MSKPVLTVREYFAECITAISRYIWRISCLGDELPEHTITRINKDMLDDRLYALFKTSEHDIDVSTLVDPGHFDALFNLLITTGSDAQLAAKICSIINGLFYERFKVESAYAACKYDDPDASVIDECEPDDIEERDRCRRLREIEEDEKAYGGSIIFRKFSKWFYDKHHRCQSCSEPSDDSDDSGWSCESDV